MHATGADRPDQLAGQHAPPGGTPGQSARPVRRHGSPGRTFRPGGEAVWLACRPCGPGSLQRTRHGRPSGTTGRAGLQPDPTSRRGRCGWQPGGSSRARPADAGCGWQPTGSARTAPSWPNGTRAAALLTGASPAGRDARPARCRRKPSGKADAAALRAGQPAGQAVKLAPGLADRAACRPSGGARPGRAAPLSGTAGQAAHRWWPRHAPDGGRARRRTDGGRITLPTAAHGAYGHAPTAGRVAPRRRAARHPDGRSRGARRARRGPNGGPGGGPRGTPTAGQVVPRARVRSWCGCIGHVGVTSTSPGEKSAAQHVPGRKESFGRGRGVALSDPIG